MSARTRTFRLRRFLPLTISLAACSPTPLEHPPGTGGSGGTGGAGGSASASATGTFSTGSGIPCPASLPLEDAPCDVSGAQSCTYPDACEARCISAHWVVRCTPPTGAPDCPLEAPSDGSPCSVATGTYKCFYDACSTPAKELAWSACDGAAWTTEYGLCERAGCLTTGSDPVIECDAASVCAWEFPACSVTPTPYLGCTPNPCLHEPFSCACASALCGPVHTCVSAEAGRVTCGEPPAPFPKIVVADAEESPSYLATDGTSFLWGDGATGEIREVPALGMSAVTRPAPDLDWSGFAVGGGSAFFSTKSGFLKGAPTQSGAFMTLGQGYSMPTQPAYDSGWLFFRAQSDLVQLSPTTLTGASIFSEPTGFTFGVHAGLITVRTNGGLTQVDLAGTIVRTQQTTCLPSAPIAFEGASVVCVDEKTFYDTRIYLVSVVDGVETPLVDHVANADWTAMSGNRVFWIDVLGRIWGMHVGDATPTLLANNEFPARDLVATSASVFWAKSEGAGCGSVRGVAFP